MESRVLVAKQSTVKASGSQIPKLSRSLQSPSRLDTTKPDSGYMPFSFGDVPVFSEGESHHYAPHASQAAVSLPWPIQTKLEVGAVDNPLEREADRVAEHVMRMPASAPISPSASGEPLQRKCKSCSEEDDQHTVRRKCESCSEEKNKKKEETHEKLLRKESHGAAALDGSSAPAIVSQVLHSPGQPLDAATRAFFEPRFGSDFSRVRVHDNSAAAKSAHAVNALAYTIGRNIVFASGKYAPRSGDGGRLLTHELAHVVQQAEAPSAQIQRAQADDPEQAPLGATDGIGAVPSPEPLDKPRLPAPNKAPSCDEICGEKEHCIQGPGERCSDDATNAAKAAFQSAANNVTTAINHLNNTPDSEALRKSLKANFNWSKGNSPAGLPGQVSSALDSALSKFSDNLCIKCRDCPPSAVAHIEKARGKDCLGYNCFVICPAFSSSAKDVQAHALLHELLHRVVSGAVEDLYRGQPGYPGPPSSALKMPDPYASLVDDLAAAGASSSPAPGPTPANPPTPAP
jgi:hypothetical protein